tara:strand:- start:273 stop:482 length:210 start_codon:yes stop_codon:yes gene_type:complete
MKDVRRDPKSINDGRYYSQAEVEREMVRAMYCLSHDAAVEEPNEAMKSSQAALNIANALAVLARLGEKS